MSKHDDPRAKTPKDSHYARLRRTVRDSRRQQDTARAEQDPDRVLLYGLHTVRAALDNPARVPRRLVATRNALARLGIDENSALPFTLEIARPHDIAQLLEADATHQGAVLEVRALPRRQLSDLAAGRLVVVLDQVTDPHNVGAIMRSAVAFGADALITTMRHSPAETGVMAKSASGALEHIPFIPVRNLAEAIGQLHDLGFFTVGLDSDATATMEEVMSGHRIALVLGAEGRGLRAKTRSSVKTLARLDMPGAIHSLNVSNAAAIALYIAERALRR